MLGGIFGVKSKRECGVDLLTGLFSLQHRGEDHCGAVSTNSRGLVSYRHVGRVLESFTEEQQNRFVGNYGLGNVHPYVKQPISFESRFGLMSISYAGKIFNKRSLRNQLEKRGHSLSIKQTEAEIVGKLITELGDTKNIVEGMKKMAREVKGVYALGILTREGLYCMRSPVGVEPLSIGSKDSLAAFSSESCALKELGLKRGDYRDVKPGELAFIGKKGIETVDQLNGMLAGCGFEPGYWGRIDSFFDGVSTKKMRERAGRILAEDDIKRGFKPEIVIPVRESGVGYAIGYSHVLGDYDEGLSKNWYITRTFLQATKKARIKGVNRKQSVIEDAVEDKIVVVVDDSIREGTTIRDKLIPLVRSGGAKEVHVRIGSPENKYVCKYSLFPKSRGKLLSAGKTLEEQRVHIRADSLEFISVDGYVESLGVPEDEVCLGCWTNEFPI